MNIQFIRSSEKKEIIKQLNEQFGISELPYLLIESGKEKIRFFSGHLSKEEILKISDILNVELIGMYAIKKEYDLRLTIDSAHLLKEQINKNIIEISNEQTHEWIRVRDLPINNKKGTLIIKNNQDFIGCGKSSGISIFNYVPKDRRLRK